MKNASRSAWVQGQWLFVNTPPRKSSPTKLILVKWTQKRKRKRKKIKKRKTYEIKIESNRNRAKKCPCEHVSRMTWTSICLWLQTFPSLIPTPPHTHTPCSPRENRILVCPVPASHPHCSPWEDSIHDSRPCLTPSTQGRIQVNSPPRPYIMCGQVSRVVVHAPSCLESKQSSV